MTNIKDLTDRILESCRRIGYARRDIQMHADKLDDDSLTALEDCVDGLESCVRDFEVLAEESKNS